MGLVSMKANLSMMATASFNQSVGYEVLVQVPAGFLIKMRKIVPQLVWKSEVTNMFSILKIRMTA